jgi:MFS family permease
LSRNSTDSHSTIPTWVSEACKADRRGALVAFQLAIVSGGILIAYWLDYGMLYAKGQVVWRFPVAFQAVFCIATIGMVHFLPESPRLLYDKGRVEEADEILCRLKDLPLSHPDLQKERDDIFAAIALEHNQPKMTLRKLLFEKTELKLLRRIVIGFSCQCIQQLTGIAVVIGYLPYVAHNEIGLSEHLAQIMGGIGAIVYLCASFPPMYFGEFLHDIIRSLELTVFSSRTVWTTKVSVSRVSGYDHVLGALDHLLGFRRAEE